MTDEQKHAIECDRSWQHQEKINDTLFERTNALASRVNTLEVRIAYLAALGGAAGGALSNFLF